MPTVSIITATYNRSYILSRAIQSVLNQTFGDWELIIVDDGSTDETQEILSHISDQRVRIIRYSPNRGVAFARNRGLDVMQGEWFTLLDSDDEIVPEALEILLKVPQLIDKRINAITCNCIDSISGKFTGYGLEKDQWLDFETLVTRCYGEHWGITKTSLLGDLRFNEALPWGESVLWYRISKSAFRYYIHKGLRIYHTEGQDRLCGRAIDVGKKCTYYRELAREKEYLGILKQYRPSEFSATLFRMAIVHMLEGDVADAQGIIFEGREVWDWKQRLILRIARTMRPVVLRKFLSLYLKYR
jgi:GalNAc5-diNAcBac-PP-undecaprenol beta-1,3-glucosyltransferase